VSVVAAAGKTLLTNTRDKSPKVGALVKNKEKERRRRIGRMKTSKRKKKKKGNKRKPFKTNLTVSRTNEGLRIERMSCSGYDISPLLKESYIKRTESTKHRRQQTNKWRQN
jgi:hypothetical protein